MDLYGRLPAGGDCAAVVRLDEVFGLSPRGIAGRRSVTPGIVIASRLGGGTSIRLGHVKTVGTDEPGWSRADSCASPARLESVTDADAIRTRHDPTFSRHRQMARRDGGRIVDEGCGLCAIVGPDGRTLDLLDVTKGLFER